MVSVNKVINSTPCKSIVKPNAKAVAKAALPAASALGVLAGSSMSGTTLHLM